MPKYSNDKACKLSAAMPMKMDKKKKKEMMAHSEFMKYKNKKR